MIMLVKNSPQESIVKIDYPSCLPIGTRDSMRVTLLKYSQNGSILLNKAVHIEPKSDQSNMLSKTSNLMQK